MIRSVASILILAAGWSLNDLNLDRLRWNARERTESGIERLDTQDGTQEGAHGAVEAFETAARLDPNDPLLRFNAGSAHLVAGSEGGLEHLRMASETAPDELRPGANYNLGNAQLAAGDLGAAIEAYEDSLRADPDHESAKFNLELALQQQQQQQEQEQQQQEPQEQQEQEQQDSSDNPESGEQDQPEPQESPSEQPEPQPGEGDQDQQLPQFEDQPDMTAEQAAAILEAVENLEREQRRKQAAEERKKRPRKGKDW